MIIITPEATKELQDLASGGGPSILRLDADPDDTGSFDCSVALVSQLPEQATVESIGGVTVAFCGSAENIFDGATLSLSPEGELALDMAEGDYEGCGLGCSCGGGSCELDEDG